MLFLTPTPRFACAVQPVALRDRHSRKRRNAADVFRTGRKLWRRNQEFIALRFSRTTSQARTGICIPVRVRSGVAIGERLEESHDLILLLIRQSEFACGHVDVVLDLGPRPAVNPLDSSGRTVS